MRPLAEQRSRLFDQEAERYDRCRPSYPDVVIDELLGPEPAGLDVLDVGCGTGIASRPMAERGAKVLGVEVAPRMAEIARSHGIDVEIGAFEDWDAAGRTFDRVTSAQAWHWLDMPLSHSQGGFAAATGRQAWPDLERRTLTPTISPMLSRRYTPVCSPPLVARVSGMRPAGRRTGGLDYPRSSMPSPR